MKNFLQAVKQQTKKLTPREWFNEDVLKKTYQAQKKYGFKIGSGEHATWNNEADAFKHAYMQWSLVQYVGYKKAKELGNMHEDETPNAPYGERNMDLWNNAIGREIALEMNKNPNYDLYDDETRSDIAARKIYERMLKGDLITNPNDKRKFENMELERLTEADRVYSNGEFASFKENVTTMVMDKYLDYVFSNDMERPTEENLNKRVLSGELIYVENYERADGTRVHGYYRRKPVK